MTKQNDEIKHTPIPWFANGDVVVSEDEIIADCFQLPEGNARFIVEAVNNHERLKKREQELIELVRKLNERMKLINRKCVYPSQSDCPNHSVMAQADVVLNKKGE